MSFEAMCRFGFFEAMFFEAMCRFGFFEAMCRFGFFDPITRGLCCKGTGSIGSDHGVSHSKTDINYTNAFHTSV